MSQSNNNTMNYIFIDKYKKCFNTKYSELCKALEKSADKTKCPNSCDNTDVNTQIKIETDVYCRETNKIYQYPRFK